ncbi:MAG: uroporphyrinogen decarboxylase family protein, partial [Bacteroidales bacterium]|nr:uroporphyrinogen decarboxylase family protein [Bacteroidales bacterium]
MGKINMNSWKNDIILQKRNLVVPIMTHPGIELIGKKVIDAVTNGEIQAQAILKLNEIYPSDACTVIMDLTVEAEAFGAPIVFPMDEVPSVTNRCVFDFESVEKLQVPSLNSKRVPEYLKANRIVAKTVIDKPVFAGCIGPYTLAGRLYDMTELMMAAYTEPQTALLLLEKCTQFLVEYCQAIKDTGVSGVVIAEPAAGLLSNEDCSTYSSSYIKKIVEAVQDETFMVVLHNCGNTGNCTLAMLEAGAMAYHFGNKIDIVEALKICPADVLVMGNIDPVGVMKLASPEEITQVVKDILDKTKTYPNFILSTGCDVPPHVSIENIEALYN